MHKSAFVRRYAALAALLAAIPCGAARAGETVLHTFTGQPDAIEPDTGLTSDASGNLYGLTESGGQYNYGAVYQLTQDGHGHWTYNEIWSVGGSDGQAFPEGRVAVGADGHLWITTSLDNQVGNGGVFELVPGKRGVWQLGRTALFNGQNAASPSTGAVIAPNGHLYGSSRIGGIGNGTVYEVIPTKSGLSIQALHTFQDSRDGVDPTSELLLDKSGDLYGTAQQGFGFNTPVFKLHHEDKHWRFSVIRSLNRWDDQYNARGPLVEDSAGNLYGTADFRPNNRPQYLIAFKLSPPANGDKWKFTKIYQTLEIHNNGIPGIIGAVTLDAAENLYFPIGSGGRYNMGRILELSPTQTGRRSQKPLYSFKGNADGGLPVGPVIFGPDNRLYGTANGGGNAQGLAGDGVVFSLSLK